MNTAEIFPWLNGLKLWFTIVFVEFIRSGSLWCSCTTRCTTGDTCMLLHFFALLNILFCKQPNQVGPQLVRSQLLHRLPLQCSTICWNLAVGAFLCLKTTSGHSPVGFYLPLCAHIPSSIWSLITQNMVERGRWDEKLKEKLILIKIYIKLRLVPDIQRVCYVQQEFNYNK